MPQEKFHFSKHAAFFKIHWAIMHSMGNLQGIVRHGRGKKLPQEILGEKLLFGENPAIIMNDTCSVRSSLKT